MCINCRKATIEDIAILGNAAVAAYNTNSKNQDSLLLLQRTLIDIEQLHAEIDLAETRKLSDQYKSAMAGEDNPPDQTTGVDADKDAMVIINGASGIGKGYMLKDIGKALLDLGYVAEGYSEDVLLVRDPLGTIKNRTAEAVAACSTVQPQPPVEVLTPSEVEVAKLIRSRLFKVLGDLPTYGGYRELTIEQLDARLSDEIEEFNRSVGLR